MNIDAERLSAWIGNSESRTERLSAAPACSLAATLNRADTSFKEGDELPPGWQWLYFLPCARQSDLGADGHPKLGGFMPPIPLPRRMWAAGKMTIAAPLRIGEEVTRTTCIENISVKEGRSGTLIFVKLRHELATASGTAISEEQDLVYRAHPEPGQAQPPGKPAPGDELWRNDIDTDPTLLFRYSALTFNAHRIHYDESYAVNQEHYPGLVVQGPLIATLLLELMAENLPDGKRLREFSFRAVHPTFVNSPFSVCAKPKDDAGNFVLWGRDREGVLTMDASATTA